MNNTTRKPGPTALTVGKTCRELRTRRGITQLELAAKIKEGGHALSNDLLARIEAGTRNVTVDDLVALAAALHVRHDVLLFGTTRKGSK